MFDVLTATVFVVKMLVNSDSLDVMSSSLFEVVSPATMVDD